MICLRRRELPAQPGTVVTEITLDHEFLMSSHNTASERALARRGLELHAQMHAGRDLNVLVAGVAFVELLPQVIDWLNRGLLPLAQELRADARFAVAEGDAYARLSAPPERQHDLILIDVDHSPDECLGAANGSFYSKTGLALVKRHLAPGGVLGVWSYAESPSFAASLREVFSEVRIEPVCFGNSIVGGEETNWLFFARG